MRIFNKEGGPLSKIRKKVRKLKRLTWFCRIVIFGAGAFSIWANVLHARPGWVPLGIAAAPPLFVLAGWEMVSRIPLRSDASKLKRFIRPFATAGIAAGAALLSYLHQKAAIWMYSGDDLSSKVLPGLVDGLMIIASVSVMELNQQIADWEAVEEGQQVRITSAPGIPVKTKRMVQTGSSKKEKVSRLLGLHPDWTIGQIAEAAGASYGYTAQLVQELSKAGGAELIHS
jgi:hypothetical protein